MNTYRLKETTKNNKNNVKIEGRGPSGKTHTYTNTYNTYFSPVVSRRTILCTGTALSSSLGLDFNDKHTVCKPSIDYDTLVSLKRIAK